MRITLCKPKKNKIYFYIFTTFWILLPISILSYFIKLELSILAIGGNFSWVNAILCFFMVGITILPFLVLILNCQERTLNEEIER